MVLAQHVINDEPSRRELRMGQRQAEPPAAPAETGPKLLLQQELLISHHGASRPLRAQFVDNGELGSWAAAAQRLGVRSIIVLPTLFQGLERSLQFQRERKKQKTNH